jgi:hypothetical protein
MIYFGELAVAHQLSVLALAQTTLPTAQAAAARRLVDLVQRDDQLGEKRQDEFLELSDVLFLWTIERAAYQTCTALIRGGPERPPMT